MSYKFKKEERLCSHVLIDKLFHNGSSFVVYPFRVVYLPLSLDEAPASPVQVIISVSKRRFKHAHDRNSLKRLMREVYRKQKSQILYPQVQLQSLNLLLAIQYVAKDIMSYDELNVKLEKALSKLVDEISK